jgi:hypothetical protein
MNRLLASFVAVAAVLSFATGAHAADKKLSISAFGQVSKYSGSDASGSIFLEGGYLFTDRLEGQVRLSQTLGAGELTLIGVGAKYYFGGVTQAKSWLPYAHASINRSVGGSTDITLLRVGPGIDLPVNESTSVSIEGAYVRQEAKAFGFTNKTNGSEIVVGLKIRF